MHHVPSVHYREDLVASVNLGPEYLYSRSGKDLLFTLSYIKLSLQSYVFTPLKRIFGLNIWISEEFCFPVCGTEIRAFAESYARV